MQQPSTPSKLAQFRFSTDQPRRSHISSKVFANLNNISCDSSSGTQIVAHSCAATPPYHQFRLHAADHLISPPSDHLWNNIDVETSIPPSLAHHFESRWTTHNSLEKRRTQPSALPNSPTKRFSCRREGDTSRSPLELRTSSITPPQADSNQPQNEEEGKSTAHVR